MDTNIDQRSVEQSDEEQDEINRLKKEIESLKGNLLREAHLRKVKYFARLEDLDDYHHCEYYFPEYCDYCLEQFGYLNLCFRCYRHICRSCLYASSETEKKHGYCKSFKKAYTDTYWDEDDPERTEIPVDSYLCE